MRAPLVALSVSGAVLFGAQIHDAAACGGFFCDRSEPVDQVGEKILFVVDSDAGTVEAHIQIQYDGSATDFSWVVPVTAIPTLDVGSDEVFTRLLGATGPRYGTDYSSEGSCETCGRDLYDYDFGVRGESFGGGGLLDGDGDVDQEGVEIVDSGIVGPFETVTLAADDPAALSRWLGENGYDLPATAEPIIAAYVAAGYYFVGLKLTKESDTGDLRPIVLRSSQTAPCIPLRLTAVAAAPDMPVYAWILGDHRFVSTNYLDVVPNDAWFYTGTRTYSQTVAEAIDEAGGRAFVTEMAQDAADYADAMSPGNYDTEAFRRLTTPRQVMDEIAAQGFAASQLVFGILVAHLPPPDGVEARDFYNCPECYDVGDYTFDADALADALEDAIVRPLREVHEAFGRSEKLTRLYTVISPAEMTEDPEFVSNADLGDVPREREGTATRDCRDTMAFADDYMKVVTPAGHRFCAPDLRWDGWWWYESDGAVDGRISGYTPGRMPSVERAVRYGATGAGEVVLDEAEAIDANLHCPVPKIRPDLPDQTCEDWNDDYYYGDGDSDGDEPYPSGDYGARGGSLCAAVPGQGTEASLAALSVVALAVALRRRRVD